MGLGFRVWGLGFSLPRPAIKNTMFNDVLGLYYDKENSQENCRKDKDHLLESIGQPDHSRGPCKGFYKDYFCYIAKRKFLQ